jgi:hypothetical protein
MSKCDITIQFDRESREYVTGEAITGVITVEANKSLNCDGLMLQQLWRTHGWGNIDKEVLVKTKLWEGEWEPGQVYRYPFELIAPPKPMTYRGHYINVDHYIQVRASVPWAIDVKHEDDYILLPSESSTAHHNEIKSKMAGGINIGFGNGKSFGFGNGIKAGIGGIIVCIILLLACFPFAIVLIPLILIGAIWSLRNVLAQLKIGKVEVEIEETQIVPTERINCVLAFTPKKQVTVNTIIAKLTGEERCVSGSGSNRTTHTHSLYEKEFALSAPTQYPAGEPVRLTTSIELPATNAYTFNDSNNDVNWKLELRVDIPKWPDWVKSTDLILHPAPQAAVDQQPITHAPKQTDAPTSTQPTSTQSPLPADAFPAALVSSVPGVDDRTDHANEAADEALPIPTYTKSPESNEQSTDSSATASDQRETENATVPGMPNLILDVIEGFEQADSFSGDADKLLASLAGKQFNVDITLDRVNWTTDFDLPEDYRSGRMALGKLNESAKEVAIYFPKAFNDAADALKTGQSLSVQGTVAGWDRLYKRLKICTDKL